jgi:hypothetical protein
MKRLGNCPICGSVTWNPGCVCCFVNLLEHQKFLPQLKLNLSVFKVENISNTDKKFYNIHYNFWEPTVSESFGLLMQQIAPDLESELGATN